MNQFPTLYKYDTKGKIREWRMEVDGDRYRTIAGLQDGNQVTSGWTTAEAKNVGSSNEKTPFEQAIAEVESQYKKKLSGEYHEDIKNISQGAKFFKPMLANKWEKRKDKINYSDDVFVQPKLDGIRCIANRDGVWSRTGKPIVAIPHIVELLAPLFEENPDAVLDGELYNHDLKEDFNSIVSMVRKAKPTIEDLMKSAEMVQYHVYDFPGLIDSPFKERFAELERLISQFAFGETIQVVPTGLAKNEEDVDGVYGEYLEDGYEGGIIRLNGTGYDQKRSNNLIKRKDFEDAEFEILRIEEGNGNWAGVAKKVFFRNDQGECGEVGAGLKGSKDYARHVLENADSYIGKQVTVQFFTRTPDLV
ncbi:MAG: ATP-dependent DNA ligase, partial [Candidatus Kariarchaeaceae archaeon]